MRFPETEAEIAALAMKVAHGLATFPEEFPSPPIAPDRLKAKHEELLALRHRILTAESELKQLHQEKDQVLKEMEDWTKAGLRYGEIEARGNPNKLIRLGWGPPRERQTLARPGGVRNIRVGEQGETTVELSWKAPHKGGKVAAYQVQRRISRGKWENIQTQVALEVLLQDQPRGVELEYRVVGVNRAGEGTASATVSVVL